MKRYETVLHIVNYGDDRFDAGERAGDLIDLTKFAGEIFISCEPTREIEIVRKEDRPFFRFNDSELVGAACL